MPYAILRTAKLKTNGSIGASLDHNYRERYTHNADPQQTLNNGHDLNCKDDAYDAIHNRLPEKVRKDGVRCIEYMITASPEFFNQNTRQTQDEYFRSAKDWLIERHGEENVITTSIHRDETSPHLIAYVVPYVWNEKKKKETLNCKHYLGGRKTLSEMQTHFHKHVAHFGLDRGVERSVAQHQTIKEFYSKIQNPLPNLKEISVSIEIPKAKLLGSKHNYGVTVANSVWEQACSRLESAVLKTTYKNFTLLTQENEEAKNKISALELINKERENELRRLKNSNNLLKEINKLPISERNEIEKSIIKRAENIEMELLINPIKIGHNHISYKWNKSDNVFDFKINEQQINKKVPLSFLIKLKENDKFLNNFSIDELYNGKLSFSKVKNGSEPRSFNVTNQGEKIIEPEQNKQKRTYGFSM